MNSITYTFKEVCDKTEYKPSVIRYYEKEFALNIPRDNNGRRYFTEKEIDKLLFIKKMQEEGYTNSQIKRLIEDKATKYSDEVAATYTQDSISNSNINSTCCSSDSIRALIEDHFIQIKSDISELSEVISSKERDQLITENMKLKMELKQKGYEIMELKEKLRYEKERKKGLFNRLLKKSN